MIRPPDRLRWRGFNFANPLSVYTVLWVGVLILASLRVTAQLVPLNLTTVLLVAANIATFVVLYGVCSHVVPGRPSPRNVRRSPESLNALRRFITWLLAVWLIGTIVEAYLAGGIPIVWVLTGRIDKDYRNFGLPSLHGLLMAFYLFSVTGLFLDYCIERRWRTLAIVGVLLAWPLALVNRGAFTWALLEIAAIYLLLNRVGVQRLRRVAAAVLAAVLIFGMVGDLRLGDKRSFLVNTVSPDYQPMMEVLPSGFLWVYIYVTSPINNVTAGIERLSPNYVVYYSVINLLPTVIRDRVYGTGSSRYPMQLVNEAFNTSTWYSGFLSDVGIGGAILIVAVLQLITAWTYVYARRGEAWAMLAYAAVFEGLTLSIFADTFTSLVTLAQIGLALVFLSVSRRAVGGVALAP